MSVLVLLVERNVAVREGIVRLQRQLDLIGHQRCVHRRLQQLPVPGRKFDTPTFRTLPLATSASSASPVSVWCMSGRRCSNSKSM